MPTRYFENLPNMYYSNTLCKDISRRVKLVDDEQNSPYVFYPYTINHQLRSDQIAEYYFENSRLDWLIYLSNQIIDPYYGWYLDETKLMMLLIEKYGSVEKAIKKVVHYQNNWANDPYEITADRFNSTLSGLHKKYYSPNWGPKGQILSYRRKEEDITMNTNRILQYTISAVTSNNEFIEGEIVDLRSSGVDTVATGECVVSNSSTITIQSVSGNTIANSSVVRYMIGEDSEANVTVNSLLTVHENITESEGAFWTSVSYYDYELAINESKKDIRLVDLGLTDFIIQEFQRKVNDDIDPEANQ